FMNNSMTWLSLVHPDDRVLVSKTVDDYEAHNINSFRLYYRIITKNGDSIPVTEYNTVNRNKDGSIYCYDSVIISNTHTEESRLIIDDHYRQQVVLNDIMLSLHDSDLDHAIQIILDRTGEYLDTSRALLFKDSPDHKTCKIVYEWCNKDIESVMALDYSITYSTGMPEIYVALQTTGNLLINYGEIPENCKEEFEAEGLIASAIFAVYLEGDHYGFVCFDDCIIERTWDENTTRFLKNVSNLISTVVARQKAEERLSQNQKTYETVLNHVDSYIFVIDPQTQKIIFANQAFKNAFGAHCIDQLAHLYLDADYSRLLPSLLSPEDKIKSDYPEIYSPKTDEWLAVSSEEIIWIDGKKVQLINCYDTTAKRRYADAIEKIALLDHLTGLGNRYSCDIDLEQALKESKECSGTDYLLFIDIDDFKEINDTHGHDYGDDVLVSFAAYLKELVLPPNKIFRFGGDEFVLLISHKSGDSLESILQALQERVRKPWKSLDKEFCCTLSIGIVEFSKGHSNSREVVKHADIALYEAKRQGKNKYVYYGNELDPKTN
ncbi:diguanylate cyclase, partial [Porphyromonadaceae bacterium OttesenSCG-928-L07]|nr:diguanylate cyclase [Porphyromonadaceae bacterium OttesenSCG-928-L07]